MTVKLSPDTQPVSVAVDSTDGNVVLTPDQTTFEIIADANLVCVDPDGQPTVEVTPQNTVVAVTASVEPAQPVEVEVGQAVVNVTASTVGMQGPPGPPGTSSTVTYVTPQEFLQDTEFAWFGWSVWPNAGDGWRILRVSVGTNPQRVKATVLNNAGYADFTSAWADRELLNYEPG